MIFIKDVAYVFVYILKVNKPCANNLKLKIFFFERKVVKSDLSGFGLENSNCLNF